MDDLGKFEAVVLATEGALRSYIAGMGVGRHGVDDIAQETYLAVWERGLPEGIEPLRWLKGIARKKAIDQLRATSPRRRILAELVATAATEGDSDDQPALGALRRCLEQLLPADHDLLRRHYQDEESGDVIARARGVDGSTVRKQLMRLREALEKCITRRLATGSP